MKPPARKRNKPDRNLNTESPQSEHEGTCLWQRVEQKNLLAALKTISRINGGNGDIDYDYLKKHVPTRSIPEIQSVVEYLKSSVISLASIKLKKKTLEEKKFRKPIELWTSMASTLAGKHEEPISTAFSQMLIVSSTEPCTLRYCDPPQVHRPPTDQPVGRTVPFRPMPRLPVKVAPPGTNAARPVVVLKTPGPAMGPAPSQVVRGMNGKVPPPQQHLSTTAGTSPASTSTSQSGTSPASTSTSQSGTLPARTSTSQSGTSPASTSTSQSAAISCQPGVSAKILAAPATSPQPASQTATPVTGHDTPGSGSAAVAKTQTVGSSQMQTPQEPSEQSPTTISAGSTSTSDSSGPHATLSSSSASGQTPVPSRAPSSVPTKPPLSSPAAAFHANFGRTNKHSTKDSPRVFGVKSVVDFERIYRYLSGIHQPNDDLCHLTPMESAIMLDLLMSLPEELPLLDCNKLHKHLIEVYQCLSSTADSKMAVDIFKELKDGLCARGGKRTNHQQSAAPQSADPQSANHQSADPQSAAAQSADPQSAAAQSADPQSAAPQSAAAQSADPQSADPQSADPQSAAPQSAAPQSAAAHSATAQSPAGGDVAASGGKKPQPDGAENESSGSGNASGSSGDADEMDLFPPLNPFMVPLKLLRRK